MPGHGERSHPFLPLHDYRRDVALWIVVTICRRKGLMQVEYVERYAKQEVSRRCRGLGAATQLVFTHSHSFLGRSLQYVEEMLD